MSTGWGDDWSVSPDDFFAKSRGGDPAVFNVFAAALQERVDAVFGIRGGGLNPAPLSFTNETWAFSFFETGTPSGTFAISIGGTATAAITYSTVSATLVTNIQSACDTAFGSGNVLVGCPGYFKLVLIGSNAATSKLLIFDCSLLVNVRLVYASDIDPGPGGAGGVLALPSVSDDDAGGGDALLTATIIGARNFSMLQASVVYIAYGFIPDGMTIAGSAPTGVTSGGGGADPPLGFLPFYPLGGPVITYAPTPYNPSDPYHVFPPSGWNRKWEQQIYATTYASGSGRAMFVSRVNSTAWWSCPTNDPLFGTAVTTPSSEYKYSGFIMEGSSGSWTLSADQTSPVDIIHENLLAYQTAGGAGYGAGSGLVNFSWPGDMFDGDWLNDLQAAMKLLHITQCSFINGGIGPNGQAVSPGFVVASSTISAAACLATYTAYAAAPQTCAGEAYAQMAYDASGPSWIASSSLAYSGNYVLQNTLNLAGTAGTMNRDLKWWFISVKLGDQYNDFGLGYSTTGWNEWGADTGTDMAQGAFNEGPIPAAIQMLTTTDFPNGTTVKQWGWQGAPRVITMEWKVAGGFNYQ